MKSIIPGKITTPASPQDSYEAAINERASNAFRSGSRRPKRNIGAHTKYWAPGKTLKIAMYDEDNEEVVQSIKNGAAKWLPYINLEFEYVEGDKGDIRIFVSRDDSAINESLLGTDALTEQTHLPTMTVNASNYDSRFEYMITHEFGHALGAAHAHQHPDSGIPWDIPRLYESCRQKWGWTKEMVDINILPMPRDDNYTFEPYDRDSLMHYEIFEDWTVGNWSQSKNWEISAGDIALMRKAYPR